jgi:cell division protease FtsH
VAAGDHTTPSDRPTWRVTPPAGGSESTPSGGPGGGPRFGRRTRLLILAIVGLLALNYSIASNAVQGQERVQVPYSPFFLNHASAGNVKQITSTGTAVQGTFKHAVSYQGTRATEFSTEIPEFANNDALSKLLQSEGVQINAEPLDTGPSLLVTLLFGFGPTLLLVGLLVWVFRRAAAMGGGPLGSFTRSRARRYDLVSNERVTFADVAGIDEAKDELAEVVDFLRNPARYRALGGRIPRGVLLSGPPGTARRCWLERWPARRGCRSSRCRRRSSSR